MDGMVIFNIGLVMVFKGICVHHHLQSSVTSPHLVLARILFPAATTHEGLYDSAWSRSISIGRKCSTVVW